MDRMLRGVGPWDGWIRAEKTALPQPLPLTLGSDLSGAIVAVGQGFLTSEREIRFMVLRIPALSRPMPSMLWLPQRWSRDLANLH
jgi:NADPH:quinone reductase-like Zn-dependent oxidoreductase